MGETQAVESVIVDVSVDGMPFGPSDYGRAAGRTMLAELQRVPDPA